VGTASLWQDEHPWRARPALEGEHTAAVCVIGAGVTGASCAWRLLEHGVDVTIVDGRSAAAGASGRNGGFAVTGTGLEHDELVQRLGEEPARELHQATVAALDRMVALAAELGVADAVRRTGSVWLVGEDELEDAERAVRAAAGAGIGCTFAPEMIPDALRGGFVTAVHEPQDAALLPAEWVRTLAAACAERGARLYERSPVTAVERDGDGWAVTAGTGHVLAEAVVVACDGLIASVMPQLEQIVYPVRGQVLATAPLERQPLPLPMHSEHGFMYYRPTADGRVVLGGGRLEHLEDEYTDVEVATAPVQAVLDAFLGRLGLAGALVTHRWAGIMGFSADLLPLAGPVPDAPGLHVAGGYSGVGNVLGHLCGWLVADLIATGSHPHAAAFSPSRFRGASTVEQLEKARSRELAARLQRRERSSSGPLSYQG
jgi:glycine/D-amino acid oxidase-like deaminating enzyme